MVVAIRSTPNGCAKMKINGCEIHPAAALFPPPSEDRLEELAADIRLHGLRDAVVTWGRGGPVIDGRARLGACERAGVRVEFRHISKDEDPIDHVLKANLSRLELDTGQLAMLACRIMELRQRLDLDVVQGKKLSVTVLQQRVAESLGVSKGSIERARRIRRDRPDAAAQIEQEGGISLRSIINELNADKPTTAKVTAKAQKKATPKKAYAKPRKAQPVAVVRPAIATATARQAIRLLDTIEKTDVERKIALQLVNQWLNEQGEVQ